MLREHSSDRRQLSVFSAIHAYDYKICFDSAKHLPGRSHRCNRLSFVYLKTLMAAHAVLWLDYVILFNWLKNSIITISYANVITILNLLTAFVYFHIWSTSINKHFVCSCALKLLSLNHDETSWIIHFEQNWPINYRW